MFVRRDSTKNCDILPWQAYVILCNVMMYGVTCSHALARSPVVVGVSITLLVYFVYKLFKNYKLEL